MEINKGIEPFDDRMDTTRSNPDRKQFGKSNGSDQFNMGGEYDVRQPDPPPAEVPPAPPVVSKFKHTLTNGTVLEADTVEALAGLIEKAFQQTTPPALDFEDRPLYVPLEFKRKELTVTEKAEILNLWKEDPQAATRKLQEAEFGAPIDTILQNLSRAEQRELNRLTLEAGAEFMGECETYAPTKANAKKLTDLLTSKGKPITKHNLIVAFNQLSATDKALVRAVADEPPPPPDPSLSEPLPPPTIVPSNLGVRETPPAGSVDAAKFAALPLDKQKQFFADLRRRG